MHFSNVLVYPVSPEILKHMSWKYATVISVEKMKSRVVKYTSYVRTGKVTDAQKKRVDKRKTEAEAS